MVWQGPLRTRRYSAVRAEHGRLSGFGQRLGIWAAFFVYGLYMRLLVQYRN